jgi:hypothetical protein
MSASFPYVSPAVALPTEPLRRVVDAGYYDNFGVNLAAAWLYDHRAWIVRNNCRVLLLQLRDGQSAAADVDVAQPANQPVGLWGRASAWLTAPAHGLLRARSATMAYRNSEQVEMLGDTFGKDRFSTVVLECKPRAAMSWYLSDDESALIRMSVKSEEELKKLEAKGTAVAKRIIQLQTKQDPRVPVAKSLGEQNSDKLKKYRH